MLGLADPFNELVTLLIGGFLGGIFGRHVVYLHVCHSLLPVQERGRTAGALESRLKIDPRLRSATVASGAVFINEGSDLFLEDLLSISSECCFVRADISGLRPTE